MSASGRRPCRWRFTCRCSQFQLECSFEAQNEVVVLFGASGAGKTSVLDCIAGFRAPRQRPYCAGRPHRFLQ